MKIAVFGWYGHDNAGDERIKFCLQSFLSKLGGIDNVDFYDLHAEGIKGATNKFDHYNLVIIGGGGLILSPKNYHDFIIGIQTKIVVLGISVETVLKGNPKKFAEALLYKSSAFLVRDKGSYEKLQPLAGGEKVKVSSDLTFLIPYNVVPKTNNNTIGINLFPKTFASSHLRNFQHRLGCYFKFLQPKILDFSNIIENISSSSRLLPIPLYCVKQSVDIQNFQMNDVQYLSKHFTEVPGRFIHKDIDKCCLIFSMRLHGLVFALQKGIPFITLDSYPKQINLMRDIGLSDYLLHIDKIDKIELIIDKIHRNEKSIIDKILNYREEAIDKIKRDVVSII